MPKDMLSLSFTRQDIVGPIYIFTKSLVMVLQAIVSLWTGREIL